jgi:hypothetical protein
MLPLNAANSYAGGLGSLIAPYASSKSTTTQKQGFGLQQALGLAAMVAGAATGNPMAMMGGLNMAGSSSGGMAPIISPTGTSNYFAQNPFGGNLGYTAGFGG